MYFQPKVFRESDYRKVMFENTQNAQMEVSELKKYRIYKGLKGYNVFRMRDEGIGWSKEFHSHYDTREAAEQAIKRMQEQEARDNARDNETAAL